MYVCRVSSTNFFFFFLSDEFQEFDLLIFFPFFDEQTRCSFYEDIDHLLFLIFQLDPCVASVLSQSSQTHTIYVHILFFLFSYMYTHVLKIWGSSTTRACETIMMMSQRGCLILKEREKKKKKKMGILATLVLFSFVHIFLSLSLSCSLLL
jgi:hypothetical protein